MKRLALDVLTVLSLVALAVVATFWGRSYFYRDIVDSYYDVPAPPPGESVPSTRRTGWRERTMLSFPGRFEFVSVRTTVRDRRQGPATTQPTRPNFIVNAAWLDQRGSLDWRPSTVPRLNCLRGGFGAFRQNNELVVEYAYADYRETRAASAWGVAAPYWPVAALLAVLPAFRCAAAWRAGLLRPFLSRLMVVSLLLLLAVVVWLWARSYFWTDIVNRSESFDGPPGARRYTNLTVFSKAGVASIYWHDQHPGGSGAWMTKGARYQVEKGHRERFVLRPVRDPEERQWVNRLGFYLSTRRTRSTAPERRGRLWDWGASVPYWFLTALVAVIPVWYAGTALRGVRRGWRLRHGLCPRCGYDVRASGECCSECGEPPTPSAAPGAAHARRGAGRRPARRGGLSARWRALYSDAFRRGTHACRSPRARTPPFN